MDDLREGLIIGEVLEPHCASRGATVDRPGARTISFYGDLVRDRSVHHDLVFKGLGFFVARDSHESRQRPDQLVESLAGHGRDARNALEFVDRDVTLRAHDYARARQEIGLVVAEFAQQHLELLFGWSRSQLREVEEHAEHAGSLHVTEKSVAETAALGRAFDEPGYVRHDEFGRVAASSRPRSTRTTPRLGTSVVKG